MPVFDEPHQASAGTWQRSAEKNLLPFKSCIAAFCDRLDLEWAKPSSSWRLLTLWPLTWTLPALVCVTNMFYGRLVTLEPTCFGYWVQLALEITLFSHIWMVQMLNCCVTLHVVHIYSKRATSSSEEVINFQATVSADQLLLPHKNVPRSSLSGNCPLLGACI